jgi:hypothetical protein
MSSATATSVFYQTDGDVDLSRMTVVKNKAADDEQWSRCDFSTLD